MGEHQPEIEGGAAGEAGWSAAASTSKRSEIVERQFSSSIITSASSAAC